jgi:uncharacterized membrane protein HdeD (DUF308 family)
MDTSQIEAAVQKTRENWWLFLILGTVLAILGMVALSAPLITAIAVTAVLGLVLIVGGILHAVHAFALDGARTVILGIVLSVFYILVGFFLMRNPISSVLTMTLLLGIFFVVSGIVKIAQSAQRQYHVLGVWGWYLFSGIVSLILGALIWSHWPSSAIWAIGLLLGIDLIVTGFSLIAFGVMVHATHVTPAQPAIPQT